MSDVDGAGSSWSFFVVRPAHEMTSEKASLCKPHATGLSQVRWFRQNLGFGECRQGGAQEESGGHKNNSRREKVLPSTSADSHSTHMYVCMSAYLYVYVYVCVCVLILYMYGYVYSTGM